ncbi:MAG: glutathione S-transferase family protein [Allosphingosinicella sp.]
MALTVWTYDWVPGGEKGPRGLVRDLRLRWALEEAGLPYEVSSTPFDRRGPEHLAHQPFGQVPFLTDGEFSMFESGACLLHIAAKSDRLMPPDATGGAETLQWVIAALNSIEMVTVPWWVLSLSGDQDNKLAGWVRKRLGQLETVIGGRQWLAASRFTVADLLMADVLRVPALRAFAASPILDAYLERVCDRPAFRKAHADQLAYFRAGDEARGEA